MSGMIYKKKSSLSKYLAIFIFVVIAGAGGFLYLSPQFEKNAPDIKIGDELYWNLKKPLKLDLSDESGIKYARVSLKSTEKEISLEEVVFDNPEKELKLKVNPPKLDMFFKAKEAKLQIEAIDASKWNFFEGNRINRSVNITLDSKKPIAEVISNSLAIRRGGSAAVVVHVKDENLKDAYISFNNEVNFKLIPFYKPDYFIALIAWPVDIEEFSRVNLIAVDKAENITKTKVPLYIRELKFNEDDIKISDSFIDNVSGSVLEQSGMAIPQDKVERFIEANRDLREKNIKTIKDTVLNNMNTDMVDNFSIKVFKRLRGSKTISGFADKRHYYYNDEKIDEAWHLGMDWASVKKAVIRASNPGRVIFNDYLGIYGNSVIIDHKLGLASLYAHASSSSVVAGDEVKAKQKIAHTGATGAVFGDHLHFGVLVQGIEVNPREWMDANWIKTRITNVIKDAKKIIDSE